MVASMKIQKEKIIELLREVQDIILTYYKKSYKYSYKADNSPLTEVDLIVNDLICRELTKLTPTIPIISEENDPIFTHQTDLQNFCLIDPIDGTKGFIEENDHFTVNIAFLENKVPKYGFILIPTEKEIYFNDDFSSYKISSNGSIKQIRSKKIANEEIDVLVGSSYGSHTEDFLKKYKVRSLQKIGSAIKFCKIASGKADLYIRYGRTMEWDIAAGDAIVTKAGGKVVDIHGEPMKYAKENLANNAFLVFSEGFIQNINPKL